MKTYWNLIGFYIVYAFALVAAVAIQTGTYGALFWLVTFFSFNVLDLGEVLPLSWCAALGAITAALKNLDQGIRPYSRRRT